jgi:hypothetical protein
MTVLLNAGGYGKRLVNVATRVGTRLEDYQFRPSQFTENTVGTNSFKQTPQVLACHLQPLAYTEGYLNLG